MNRVNNVFTVHTTHQVGAILVGVLVFLLVVTLIVASVSQYFQRVVDDALLVNNNIHDHATAHAKLHELVYLLSTQRITRAGVSQGTSQDSIAKDENGLFLNQLTGDELRTDGFQYFDDTLTFSIQNTLGLVPINDSSQFWLRKYLSRDNTSLLALNSMLDKLYDYADPDDTSKAAGQEKSTQYYPANFLLQACSELHLVRGWTSYLESNKDIIINCSTRRGGRININAMPERLLKIYWPQYSDNIYSARESGEWFVNYQSLYQVVPVGINIPEQYLTTLGGDTFVINVSKGSTSLNQHVSIGSNTIQPFSYRNVLN